MSMPDLNQTTTLITDTEILSADNKTGYRSFRAGQFTFRRDEYFARISWPGGNHTLWIMEMTAANSSLYSQMKLTGTSKTKSQANHAQKLLPEPAMFLVCLRIFDIVVMLTNALCCWFGKMALRKSQN